MHITHKNLFLIPLCPALVFSVCIFGCGLDFGPGVIAGAAISDPEDCQDRYELADFIKTNEPPFSLSVVPNSRWLPIEIRHFLEANPAIARNLIWIDDTYPAGRAFLGDEARIKDLAAHFVGETRLEAAPIPVKYDSDSQAFFSEEDAWNMYLGHVAHSLKVEVYNLVSWSLVDYSEEELALIFDSRHFITYVPSEGLYKFSRGSPGGRHGVTDWSPEVGYSFLEHNQMIGTQAETVYHFTNWTRKHLVHSNSATPDNWDGYPGFPTVESILYPPEGQNHWTTGCSGTASLYIAVLHSVNIPVRREMSYFAIQGGPQQQHSRVEFPSLGFGLAHADECHNRLNRRGVNEVPVAEMFYAFDELTALIDDPPLDDGAPSEGEQAYFNMLRRNIERAFLYRADYSILKNRARYLLGLSEDSLENLLIGRLCNFTQCLWKSLFDKEERQNMTNEVDATLTLIGHGDILEGSRIVLGR